MLAEVADLEFAEQRVTRSNRCLSPWHVCASTAFTA